MARHCPKHLRFTQNNKNCLLNKTSEGGAVAHTQTSKKELQ